MRIKGGKERKNEERGSERRQTGRERKGEKEGRKKVEGVGER